MVKKQPDRKDPETKQGKESLFGWIVIESGRQKQEAPKTAHCCSLRGRDVSRPGFAGVRVDPRKDKENRDREKEGNRETDRDRETVVLRTCRGKDIKDNQGAKHSRQPDQGDDRSIQSDPAMWLDACVYRVLMMTLEWLENATRAACAKVICSGKI